ncbi:hypothetical protein [Erysipelothrix larvae]|uniref:hypothetical protein n=1 Tax=Erysipelothrix larvae TaxID=1514105 RepID=UPI000AB900E1|nr:hypothetical protein [Erysipelothrix larvae]
MPEKVKTDLFNELPVELLSVMVFDPETGDFELTDEATQEERDLFEKYKGQKDK